MPLIGITTSIAPAGRQPERAILNSAYIDAVEAAGGTPIVLPPQIDARNLAVLADLIDGVLLTGGGDVAPERYGEEAHEQTAGVSDQRDTFEIALVKRTIEDGKPLLAICRGMQILNVALGGALHQHVPDDFDGGTRHHQGDERDAPVHPVELDPASRLAAISGATAFEVNSIHHQAVKAPPSVLRPVAWAPDGVIEGLEMPEYDGWLVAVQWHPEELFATDERAAALFRAFLQAAGG